MAVSRPGRLDGRAAAAGEVEDDDETESLRTRSMVRMYMGCYVGRQTNIVLSHPSRSCRFVGGVGCVWRD